MDDVIRSGDAAVDPGGGHITPEMLTNLVPPIEVTYSQANDLHNADPMGIRLAAIDRLDGPFNFTAKIPLRFKVKRDDAD